MPYTVTCHLYPAAKPNNDTTRYGTGQKRCNRCNVFVRWEGVRCPYCGGTLRTKPRDGKSKNEHDPKQMLECSKQLMEQGLMRYCGTCGLTKPAKGVHDRCSKCDEKYTFSNEYTSKGTEHIGDSVTCDWLTKN
jgi:hypothetical protein